jgi:hypothetical protein
VLFGSNHPFWPATDCLADLDTLGLGRTNETGVPARQRRDVHTFTCVLALQIAHLMRLSADRAGLHLSVRELLGQLAGIGETVLIYPSTGGRPKVRRMLTETSDLQTQLATMFQLDRFAPRS